MDKNITIEQVEKVWNEFLERVDRAEQYQFPMIAMLHLKLEPLYEDLHKNWDVGHAETFLKIFKDIVYPRLGWVWEEEGGADNAD